MTSATTSAKWITGPSPTSPSDRTTLYLRGDVTVERKVQEARARVSALGWYRFFVNSVNQTGTALVPRWTPFDHYVEYQEYDITEHLREGHNVLAMAIGEGRFRGHIGGSSRPDVYGDRLAGHVTIDIEYTDGSTATIVSDSSWLAGAGRISISDPMLGEKVDLRVSDDNWLSATTPPPNDPGRFGPVEIFPTQRNLIPEEGGRVEKVDTLRPLSITRTPAGTQLVDFGQNAAGVVRIHLQGKAGTVVTLTHSELVAANGSVDIDYLALPPVAKGIVQADRVILDGTPTWWQPWFTIHGFRYVEIDGLPNTLTADDLEYVVLSTNLAPTGTFQCSDERLNKLYENTKWSMRSNFTDTPTDCPTRERSGWTGDIQAFAATATTYANVSEYLRRYLRNLAVEQLPDGRIPPFIPAETSSFSGGLSKAFTILSSSAGWGDVSVQLPTVLHQYYDDTTSVELAYPAAKRWVDHLEHRAAHKRSIRRRLRARGAALENEKYIVDTGFNWGEWLRPGESFIASVADSALRSGPVIATAYLEHSARQLATLATALDRENDAKHYRQLADRTRKAWRAAFIHPDGRIGMNRQDDYVRALAFGLLQADEKAAAVERLVDLIEEAGDHLGTGFLSTPWLLFVLTDNGRADVAARLLLQTTTPSWLSQVERGATTTWETWEGYTQKGKAHASHNHYAYGAVTGFLIERLVGISPAEPGFRTINIRPTLLPGLTHAEATVGTPFGSAQAGWRIDGDDLDVNVTVPEGTTARLLIGPIDRHLTPGEHQLQYPITPISS
ncbi:alpha-L-rhamnosidase [Microbacterium oleivorans]|uniref:alpha-L-rhamnosidase n=1 Tax=Microbacterium oleivorans TaxID=273677 RepID=A0A7D5F8C7_9MICO|nr:alpha-L-rhamnosidase [Microbacterium oleivorans]QLD12753.1 family 78 glycoside hydrolase catalytic domain [Microbacterium oleivorans]